MNKCAWSINQLSGKAETYSLQNCEIVEEIMPYACWYKKDIWESSVPHDTTRYHNIV